MSATSIPFAQQQNAIASASQNWAVPEYILWGVYGMETDFGKNIANSSAGAVGPFQFLPSTAKEYGYPLTNNPTPAQFWAQANATGKYLSHLAGPFHNWDQALRGYSGGGYGLSQVRTKATSSEIGQLAGQGFYPGLAAAIVGGSVAAGAGALGVASAEGAGAAEGAAGGLSGAEAAGAGSAGGGLASKATNLASNTKQALGLAALTSVLLDPNHWLRILMILGGAVLILVALIYMFKTQVMK